MKNYKLFVVLKGGIMKNNPNLILAQRYLQLLKQNFPTLIAEKNPKGSLELSHILWMLEKITDPSYKPLTTHSAWISWIQASLHSDNLITIQHERDITREIMSRKPFKHQAAIDTIETLIEIVEADLEKYSELTMHNVDGCLLTKIHGCFEGGMEHYFGIKHIYDTVEAEDRSTENAQYLIEALFGMDSEVLDIIPEFHISSTRNEDDDEITGSDWIENAKIVVEFLKEAN